MNLLPSKSFRFERLFKTISDEICADVRVANVCHPCCSPEWYCCAAAHRVDRSISLFLSPLVLQWQLCPKDLEILLFDTSVDDEYDYFKLVVFPFFGYWTWTSMLHSYITYLHLTWPN